MSREVPITSRVQPFPKSATPSQVETWATNVAGFCQGAQSPSQKDGISSIRIGALVYMQTSVNKSATTSSFMMPVVPRQDGFILAVATDGTVKGLGFTAGDKNVDLSSLADGTYYINGSYLAAPKEF